MVQTVNRKRMTTPGVILETESQSLESRLPGNGYGGFGEGREETVCGGKRALRLLYSIKSAAPYCRPLAVRGEPERTRLGGKR